jgi:hypothetical protein
MTFAKIRLLAAGAIFLCCSQPVFGKSNLSYLRSWVGKNPISLPGERPRNIYRTKPLGQKLHRLLRKEGLDRLLNDYYVMGPVKLVGDYVIVTRCERHNCDESSSFLAANTQTGDVHVAFYKLGRLEWFHTKGTSRELPREVLDDEGLAINRPFVKTTVEIKRAK